MVAKGVKKWVKSVLNFKERKYVRYVAVRMAPVIVSWKSGQNK